MRPAYIVFFGGLARVHMTDKNTLVFQSCTSAPRVEHGLCSKTDVLSSDDSIEVISINMKGEGIHLKKEVEPIAISFSSMKDEPQVSPQEFHWYLECRL
jgi:hypothetical protein